ncbi:hypothetical protein D777_03160 [Marinobacter nitratireducens]|uniref:Uncharacterized protein n=1 Tax=Marinobacter nitratireducens TaxID=1137280 RepID=A0A072MX43_9GAMM|nr:hypothetical protein D777_03160 [Marinobacter nitratireducens]
MCKVRNVKNSVDESQSEGDQSVDAAQGQPVNDLLEEKIQLCPSGVCFYREFLRLKRAGRYRPAPLMKQLHQPSQLSII